MEKQQSRGHLVFVSTSFEGHITPILQLATILNSKGFSITILHPELISPKTSNYPKFTFVSIPFKLTESGPLILNKNCEAPIHQCIKNILHSDHHHVAAVIYDSFMFCAQAIANDLGIPQIALRTGSTATLLHFSVFPELDEKDVISETESPVMLQALQVSRSFLSQNPSKAVMEVTSGITNALQNSSAIIVNSMEFLEREALSKVKQYFHAPIFTIGPLHKLAPTICSSILTEDYKCISWLNKQAPKNAIYVSFGSKESIDKQELIEIAWGLANSKQPFLWVVRPGMVCGSEGIDILPVGFEENVGERGFIVQWAPQKEVLGHAAVGGFWSHCGWNSTMESICEGVPMICKPFFGDQLLNRSYICDVWRTGLELQELERGNIERTIKRLMEGNEIRERAMNLKEKAAVCLMEGSSSSRSLNDLTNQILSA